MTFLYTVHAEFDSQAVCDEWVDWLAHGHLADVMAGGATSARVVRVHGEVLRCESQYVFPSAEAFAEYERVHAPPLRAEGLKKFPPERGVRMRRSTATVVAALPS